MTPKRSASLVVLAVLAVGLGACSSSSKQSSATTLPGATTTTAAPRQIKGNLGPCPAVFPRVQLSTLNAGVPALDTKLVPFEAVTARVCSYSLKGLLASGTVAASAVAKFETDTNALTKAPGPISCPNQNITRLFFISFQSASQRVDVGESNACGGGVSNGTFIAKEAKSWTDEVLSFATKKPSTVATTTPK